jgi:predicted nucleotidyltransferase
MSTTDVLRRIVERLDAARIPFMLTGSFVNAVYGSPRATQGIDLVIDPDENRLREFVRALSPAEYYADEEAAMEALRLESMFNVVDLATGWKVDLIIRKARAFSIDEFARRRRIELDGVSLAVATAEDTIIAKLEWAQRGGSVRQLEDVASIVRLRGAELDVGRIEHWVTVLGLDEEWRAARTLATRS